MRRKKKVVQEVVQEVDPSTIDELLEEMQDPINAFCGASPLATTSEPSTYRRGKRPRLDQLDKSWQD